MSDHGESPRVRHLPESHPPRVVLSGAIDLAAAPLLDAARARLCEAKPSDVVVDLRETTILAAPGIGFIAVLADNLAPAGHRVYVLNPGPRARRALALTNLTDIVEILEGTTARHHAVSEHGVDGGERVRRRGLDRDGQRLDDEGDVG